MLAGMIIIVRYPRAAATAAKPIPVLPLVGSIITESFVKTPCFMASSIIASATRSFTLPPGLKYSNLASTVAEKLCLLLYCASSIKGVFPIKSVNDFLMFAIKTPSFY